MTNPPRKTRKHKYHVKHHSDLRFCGCRSCSWGLHHCSWGENEVVRARRKFRRLVKHLCQVAKSNPEVEIPERISVSYTD